MTGPNKGESEQDFKRAEQVSALLLFEYLPELYNSER